MRRAALALLMAVAALGACSNDQPASERGKGEITTVAGGGKRTVTTDGVDVADADLSNVTGVAVGGDGTVYVVIQDAPSFPQRSTIARIDGDRIKALPGTDGLRDVDDIAVAPDGSVVVAEVTGKQVLRWRDGQLSVVASDLAGTPLEEPTGVAVGDDGTVYVADAGSARIGAVAPDGTSRVLKEGSSSVRRPGDVEWTPDGVLFFEWNLALIWRIDIASGALLPVAGDGDKGDGGDRGPATSAQLVAGRLSAGGDGTLFLTQPASNRVRAITSDGRITTVAGTGADGYAGDGRDATKAKLSNPQAAAADNRGGLLIADKGNGRLRRVVLSGQG